ncbi:hypothetical protein MRB53_037461 [Persea americana]|nr:hypothetical protein MRB53_037461 [Persea americana]
MVMQLQKRNQPAELAAVLRSEKARKRLQLFMDYYIKNCPQENYDYALWQPVSLLSTVLDEGETTGRAIYTVTIPAGQYTNYTGSVAGGAVAALLDGLMICTLSMIVKKGFWEDRGVSRNLMLHFFKPVAADQKLKVECVLQSTTTRMVSFDTSLRDMDGTLLVKSSQDIVNVSKAKL